MVLPGLMHDHPRPGHLRRAGPQQLLRPDVALGPPRTADQDRSGHLLDHAHALDSSMRWLIIARTRWGRVLPRPLRVVEALQRPQRPFMNCLEVPRAEFGGEQRDRGLAGVTGFVDRCAEAFVLLEAALSLL